MESEIVLDSDSLYRRLEEEDYINPGDHDPKNLKSSAFSDPAGEPSTHLERLADFSAIGKRYPECISYAVCEVFTVRQHGFDAEHRPCLYDYSHSVILSPEMDLRKQTVRRKLKKLVSRIEPC